MKTRSNILIWALLVLSPIRLFGQNLPHLDNGKTFSIHSTATGQDIGRTPDQIRHIMGTPTAEIHGSTEGFGKHFTLEYGTSSVSFTEELDNRNRDFWIYYIEINDQRMFLRVNGVDIRVGALAEELAEHFPKSWAAKRNSVVNPQNEVVLIHLGDVSMITIFINPSTGVITQILKETRLT
jgi:hypothetical protein